ncbi:ATPase family protein [Cyphellophora attinorum]|uniref:ATPase family protein n=1 Tax=Cyphellophora attinorum TaxID=1664694 RepID=A0A0N1NZR9_9EURO|nr:ATPase family protein [Phialophora attinorum]KPI42380.1 ATPase family protein [Phialophora attinorum]
MAIFTVRPSVPEKDPLRGVLRAKLTAASLLGLKLKPGDLCTIRHEGSTGVPQGDEKFAIAWEYSGTGMKDNIVQTSKALQEMHGLKLGDRVIVEKAQQELQDAGSVQLRPLSGGTMDLPQQFWEHVAAMKLGISSDCLAVGLSIALEVAPQVQDFEVVEISAVGGTPAPLARITKETVFSIADGIVAAAAAQAVDFRPTNIGGAKSQLEEIRLIVDHLLRPRSGRAPAQGLLLYGAKGVGKSLIIDELAASGWKAVIRWQPGAKLPTTFASSTLIIIDPQDVPSSRGESASRVLLKEILQLFHSIKGKPVMVVSETRHPNDVHPDLRKRALFATELEIPIPSAIQRREILQLMAQDEPSLDSDILDSMAERTHGYVGDDLDALICTVIELASDRTEADTRAHPKAALAPSPQNAPSINGNHVQPSYSTAPASPNTSRPSSPKPPSVKVTLSDLAAALAKIRPSALQEIFLETPTTRFTDIGGQTTQKSLLINAVTRPLSLAATMAKVGLPPKKGVLLYGPPGCSKTLLVRALAREAGLNFLAVKGAELISMYVGESERSMRELFRKARAASPSIIFFDEIDSIAGARSGPEASSSGSKDLNVLTTLLTEMDGFSTMSGVFVVAATNRPHALDSALLRPGRFDNVVYIPPPDLDARKQIFRSHFTKYNYVPTARGTEEDVWYFADKTDGFSGADVVAIWHRAAELAIDAGRDKVTFTDVEEGVSSTPRSISREALRGFEEWADSRMTGGGGG